MPDDVFKQLWDTAVALVLISWCFVIPYSVATGIDENDVDGLYVFSILVDVIFWTDLVLSFFTSYPEDKTGKNITDRKLIVKNYISGWFAIDFLSVFPFEPVILAIYSGSGNDMNIGNLTSIGKTARLARASKIFRLVRFIKVLLKHNKM